MELWFLIIRNSDCDRVGEVVEKVREKGLKLGYGDGLGRRLVGGNRENEKCLIGGRSFGDMSRRVIER